MAANWKMTPPTLQDARRKALSFKLISKKYQKVPKSPISMQVLVCPPYPFIQGLQDILKNSPAVVGAQDVSQFDGGSKTGEIASTMIQSMGANYAIVGHSERRAMGDTNEIVAVKLGQVLRTGMNAILCIGESVRDAEGSYLEDVKKQMKESLSRMNNGDFHRLVIAYEPVWAIGNKDNIALSGHELHQMAIYIKKVLRDLFNDSAANVVKVLYGGSVTADNAADIIWNGEVDGLLIGRASFEPKSYEEICKAILYPTFQAHKLATRQKIRNIKTSIKRKKANGQKVAAKVAGQNAGMRAGVKTKTNTKAKTKLGAAKKKGKILSKKKRT